MDIALSHDISAKTFIMMHCKADVGRCDAFVWDSRSDLTWIVSEAILVAHPSKQNYAPSLVMCNATRLCEFGHLLQALLFDAASNGQVSLRSSC